MHIGAWTDSIVRRRGRDGDIFSKRSKPLDLSLSSILRTARRRSNDFYWSSHGNWRVERDQREATRELDTDVKRWQGDIRSYNCRR